MRCGALIAAALGLAACGAEERMPPPPRDHGVPRLDTGSQDIVPHFDVYTPPVDARPDGRRDDGGSCTLGTADNCASCGNVCPPGKDSPSTARVCLSSKCDIQCKAESYDVNGDVADGCEADDDLPIHDTTAAAKSLGQVSDCQDSPVTATAVMPSDDRLHLVAPTARPSGRADWYKLHIDDKAFCVVEAEVKVSLKSLPPSALYRAVAYWVCDSGAQLASESASGNGGGELLLNPSTTCTTVGDDSGTLYIKISRDPGGAHSAASYTVEIKP
jgi:hypothetical protein